MKRYIITALISLTLSSTMTGCGYSADIGKDKATQIALEDANLTESDVTRLRVSKDRDDRQTIYEVDFTNGTTEYEYEILASNGEILSADYDESYIQNQEIPNGQQTDQQNQDEQQNNQQNQDEQQANQQNQDEQQTHSDQHNGSYSQANVQLTIEEASKLALDRVPGASAQDLKIELDYDDGRYKYEGDIIYDMKEYEFEIDADTGDFLEWKEERH